MFSGGLEEEGREGEDAAVFYWIVELPACDIFSSTVVFCLFFFFFTLFSFQKQPTIQNLIPTN